MSMERSPWLGRKAAWSSTVTGMPGLPEGAGKGVTDMVVLWVVISHACAVARMAGRSGANEAGGARV